ncbi:MAG TPA: ribonuclease III [Bacillota bacterium]|nr:ribonuclease III [Bacillota bacterium]
MDLQGLAQELDIAISDERWYRQALFHASYVNERADGLSSNERLEYLGDAVLDLVVGHYLFLRYPHMPEGDLSRLRAAVVRGNALSVRARAMGLGRFVVLGKGEEQASGRDRPSLLADLFEAVVGAIFLDQGLEAASAFILKNLAEELATAAEGDSRANYKAMLQEAVQGKSTAQITYHVVDESGPDHAKVWVCEVQVDGRSCGRGTESSKRRAEQEAARDALLRGWNPDA